MRWVCPNTGAAAAAASACARERARAGACSYVELPPASSEPAAPVSPEDAARAAVSLGYLRPIDATMSVAVALFENRHSMIRWGRARQCAKQGAAPTARALLQN